MKGERSERGEREFEKLGESEPLLPQKNKEMGRGNGEEEWRECAPPSDITLWGLFLKFFMYGCRAWGGPAAQIAMIKQELVDDERWITQESFKKVFAIYQVLPGPEATELCCYFGMVALGRIGSILAGLGFILPGFVMMLILSWVYVEYGLTNPYVVASFATIQATVAAIIIRAVHKLGDHSFRASAKTENSQSDAPRLFNMYLLSIGVFSALQAVLDINFFITLIFSGILYIFIEKETKNHYIFASIFFIASCLLYILIGSKIGFDSFSVPITFGSNGNSLFNIFLLGLIGGLVTFGGAYTTIPFIEKAAVIDGGWITTAQFLDGIALSNIVPAPTVIFTTFIGYLGGGFPGAFLMTIGIFLPAFSFTIIGHNYFERLVAIEELSSFLDGVAASVIGLVAVTAITIFHAAVIDISTLFVFFISLGAQYYFNHRSTVVVLIISSAIAGQALYDV